MKKRTSMPPQHLISPLKTATAKCECVLVCMEWMLHIGFCRIYSMLNMTGIIMANNDNAWYLK